LPETHYKNTVTGFQVLQDGILPPVYFTTYNRRLI